MGTLAWLLGVPTRDGQVVVFQPFAKLGPDATQGFCIPTLVVTAGAGQEVVVQPLAAVGPLATQADGIGVLVTGVVRHVVVIQLLPDAAAAGTHDAGSTTSLVLRVRGQLLLTQPLSALPVCVMQEADAMGVSVAMAGGQVVVVHWLRLVPATGTHTF